MRRQQKQHKTRKHGRKYCGSRPNKKTKKQVAIITTSQADADAIITTLQAAAPQLIMISNRTAAKAHELAAHFDIEGNVFACGYDELPAKAFDIIIHATSAGLNGELPPFHDAVIGAYSFCYDLSYATSDTPFIAKAKNLGCETSYDGLGMLVEQAAAAFELWRGVRPATAPVIAALRKG